VIVHFEASAVDVRIILRRILAVQVARTRTEKDILYVRVPRSQNVSHDSLPR